MVYSFSTPRRALTALIRTVVVVAVLPLLAGPAPCQTPATKARVAAEEGTGGNESDAKAKADRVREGRRLQARTLLFTLSGEARGFRDQKLRARSLARIAAALWDVADEQGRILFREAWDAARAADRESGGDTQLREEVLKLAARRDIQLAEEFLQKLKTDQQETKTGPAGEAAPSGQSLWSLPEALEKRLKLAENLLVAGDLTRALQLADPALVGVTVSTVDFLTRLREKDAAAADRRYAVMLASTGGNMLADANTVSLLSSYAFTPRLYVIFHPDGGPEYSSTPSAPPAGVGPQVRLAFFQTAAGVLLRPQPPQGQDRSTCGLAGKYMVLKRLLPLFERHAPKEIADAMRGQFESLNTQMSEDVRQNDDEWLSKGIVPEKQTPAEQEQSLSAQIENAKTSGERDDLYFRLALLALSKEDPKARDYVGKIEDGDLRRQAQSWVDWSLAVGAVKKKNAESALQVAKAGELTHIQRVWVLTQSAKLLAKTDRDQALSLLDDATSETGLIDRADPNRPRGLLAIANALATVEPSRAWDAASDAVKAANAADDFTGEGGVIVLTLSRKGQILRRKFEGAPDFDLEGIFGKLADVDFDRAVLLAGGLQGEAARTNATIAAAQSPLNDKSISAPTPKAAIKN
jgi:hypothetical protein